MTTIEMFILVAIIQVMQVMVFAFIFEQARQLEELRIELHQLREEVDE